MMTNHHARSWAHVRGSVIAAAVGGGLIAAAAPAQAQDFDSAADLDEAAWDIPGQLVVDARDDLEPSALSKLAADFGLRLTTSDAARRIEIAEVAPSLTPSVIERLRKDPRVEYVEPLARVEAFFTPNDPLIKDQWHLSRVGSPRAWDFATGRGVTVAVVDTGIACENFGPFTKGTDLATTTCVPGWNFVNNTEHANDDQGHGTHVAGTIAQSTNNAIGGAGVAFDARLMPVKVLNESGSGTTASVANGIRWAADNGAQVINLSLGGPRNARVLQSAVDYALSKGTVVVAAAGNTGGRVQYPGGSDGVIGVSASDPDDKIAPFSSRGEAIDIAAPGVNVVQQTICNRGRDKCERFSVFNGTSMASPHVAGAAALVMSLGVTDPAAVEAALKGSARSVDSSDAGKKLYGAGILDAAAVTSHLTWVHGLTRFVALLAAAWLVARGAKKKNPAASAGRLSFWIPALAAGPGLLFFAPWLLSRATLWADVVARPIADMDLYLGVATHVWLPLANALVPFALTALAYGSRRLRPVVAGFATGTAAYLVSVIALGGALGPLGHTALVAWCGLNALACLWIARTNLTHTG